MEFHNGKIYPLNGEEWKYEITHVPIYSGNKSTNNLYISLSICLDVQTSSSETRSNNVVPNSCIAGKGNLLFFSRRHLHKIKLCCHQKL